MRGLPLTKKFAISAVFETEERGRERKKERGRERERERQMEEGG